MSCAWVFVRTTIVVLGAVIAWALSGSPLVLILVLVAGLLIVSRIEPRARR